MNLDWLIVGGGIHGVHLATRLIVEGGVKPDELAIVDPGRRLLERWRAVTQVTGMSHLRSPGVHHLDVTPQSLQRFATKEDVANGCFVEPFSRPALSLFNAHCDQIISNLGLSDRQLPEKALSSLVSDKGVVTRLSESGWLESRHLLLATGVGDQPHWPEWAPRGHDRVHHVFDPQFEGWPAGPTERVAVVGGGISAAQIALRLQREGHRARLITRHEFREHQFDSDPAWLGPRIREDFDRSRRSSRRRAIITKARRRGSLPPLVHRELGRAIESHEITWDQTDVRDLIPNDEALYIRYPDGRVVEADRVLLATGFESKRPGGALVDSLIESASLPCAKCGYPIVDRHLRWHPRVFVTGPLADLEIGPISRNIAGARSAGDRIIPALRPDRANARRPLSVTRSKLSPGSSAGAIET